MFKYIPRKILKLIKSKILTYIRDENGNIKGKVIGIFLDYENLNEDEFIEAVVKGVEKHKEKEIDSLIFEDLSLINENNSRLIEERTNLKMIDGRKVLINIFPFVIRELFLNIGEEVINYEVLIIGEKEKELKFLIKELSKMIRFLTIYVKDEKKSLEIKEDILKETGLSIYCTKNINKILMNYHIIVNLSDDVFLDADKLRDKSIVFNFSNNKKIAEDVKKRRKKSLVIEDYVFKNNFYLDETCIDLGFLAHSRLYQMEDEYKNEDFKGVIIDSNHYNIKELVKMI